MKTITGHFSSPNGQPAANAVLLLQLSQDAQVVGNAGQVVPRDIHITLDANGDIPAGTEIWACDELLPSGLFFTLSIPVSTYRENYQLVGPSPISIGTLTPSPVRVAAGTQARNIQLQTNGTDNGSQTRAASTCA
jgi:hypothetical protein